MPQTCPGVSAPALLRWPLGSLEGQRLRCAVPVQRRFPPEAAWPLPTTAAAAHQPLAGLAQGRFLLHFLPQPLDPPPQALCFLLRHPGWDKI